MQAYYYLYYMRKRFVSVRGKTKAIIFIHGWKKTNTLRVKTERNEKEISKMSGEKIVHLTVCLVK